MVALSRNGVFITLILAMPLVGCGGGGGTDRPDGSDADETPTKPAVATVSFPTDNILPPPTPGTAKSLLTLLSTGIGYTRDLGRLILIPVYVDRVHTETVPGPDGGSADITAVFHANGVGDWQHIVFNGYTDDGVELNGEVLEEITGERDVKSKYPYRISYYDYRVGAAGFESSVTGTVERLPAGDRFKGPLVANLVLHDDFSFRYFYLQDFTLRDVLYPRSQTLDERALEIDGVIHDLDWSGNGFSFDVETQPEQGLTSVYSKSVKTSTHGGLRLFAGDSNVMSIEFLNVHLLHLTIEKDGVYEGYRLTRITNQLADRSLDSLAKPIAMAFLDSMHSYPADNEVELDARFSVGPKNVPLRYSWELLIRPPGSAAVIRNATAPLAQIVPDIPGSYVFRLTVSDGVNEAEDLIEFRAYDNQNFGMRSAHAQFIPSVDDPEQWIVDTRMVRGMDDVAWQWTVEKEGGTDERFEVGDFTGLVDMAGVEGLFVDEFSATLDSADFAPRLYRPFRIMDLPLEHITTGWTLVHSEITDIDGDGLVDILATPAQIGAEHGYPEENLPGVYVRYGLLEGGFGDIERLDVGISSRFAVKDVDGGGLKDIVAVAASCSFDVAFGTGSSFSEAVNIPLAGVCEEFTDDHRSGERNFVIRDLDSDSQPTIVTIAANNKDIELIDLDAAGNVIRRRILIVDAAGINEVYVEEIVVLDMNLDGLPDFAVSEKGEARVIFFFQNADGSFTKDDPGATEDNYGPYLSIGDFDGDGHHDLAAGRSKTARIWKSTASRPVVIHEIDLSEIPGEHHLGADWASFEDLDRDGDDELMLFGTDSWVLVIDRVDSPEPAIRTAWMMIPDNQQHAPGFSSTGFTGAPTVEDIDGDGRLDLLLFMQAGVYVALGKRN